jgi:transposase
MTADGYGTAEIMRATGKAKTVIWRWQERFRDEGAAGDPNKIIAAVKRGHQVLDSIH